MFGQIKTKIVDRILRSKLSYQGVFFGNTGKLTLEGELVVKDLAKFCNAYTSSAKVTLATGKIDPINMAFEEGKRAVFNRMMHYLNLDDAAIYNLYREVNNDE